MENFEKLGSFYLGNIYDYENKKTTDNLFLYDSKDLTTHAVCLGMTGSGKTGLCIDMLEEAAIDKIPCLIIDPKGDMSNLLLSFPELKPEDFKPWVSETEARKNDMTIDEYAKKVSEDWKSGIENSNQTAERIKIMKESADFKVYTPGSKIGNPISILKSLDAPSDEILNNSDDYNTYLSSMVSGLLTLIGIDADPLSSREFILISKILEKNWKQKNSVTLEDLINCIQNPGIEKVGVLPLELFYPKKDRFELIMKFNNLIASPSFTNWMEGEDLDIKKLLYNEDGKPVVSIFSINHLSDRERMYFVSIFLNQVLSWIRTEAGTSSLRAILYMDEIYGYFPPVKNPPSKKPLLTLLKQARAFGLGIVLTTQNPVDLDYKGLSNIGTWFIGRLQTKQDKEKLINGLKSADNSNQLFDETELDTILSELPSRTFLVNNVHESQKILFKTRFCLSYLAGPLTGNQISMLKTDTKKEVDKVAIKTDVKKEKVTVENYVISEKKPSLHPEIDKNISEFYLPSESRKENLVYFPYVYAISETTFENSKYEIFETKKDIWNTKLSDSIIPVNWENLSKIEPEPQDLSKTFENEISFSDVDTSVLKSSSFTAWSKDLKDSIYKDHGYTLYKNNFTNTVSKPNESKKDFSIRINESAHEKRDLQKEKLEQKYSKKYDSLIEKINKAKIRIEKEKAQAEHAKINTFVNLGSTILDGFFGNKKLSKTTLNKAATSARSVNRTYGEISDIQMAEKNLIKYQEDLKDLEKEFEEELNKLSSDFDAAISEIEEINIKPKKSDINIKLISLLWIPLEQEEKNE